MANIKKISLGIGIAIILALFTGFLAWQIGDSVKESCKEKIGSLPIGLKYDDNRPYYDAQQQCDKNSRTYFGWVAIIVGVIAVVIGIIISKNMTIAGGLIGGGIINFVIGLIAFWDKLEGWMRVAMAGLVLVALILLAYFKLGDKKHR